MEVGFRAGRDTMDQLFVVRLINYRQILREKYKPIQQLHRFPARIRQCVATGTVADIAKLRSPRGISGAVRGSFQQVSENSESRWRICSTLQPCGGNTKPKKTN